MRAEGDTLFDTLGDLLLASKFAEVDKALVRLQSSPLSACSALAALSITRPFSGHLTQRETFYAHVDEVCELSADEISMYLRLH